MQDNSKVRACQVCGGTTYERLCGLCARIVAGWSASPDGRKTCRLDRRYR